MIKLEEIMNILIISIPNHIYSPTHTHSFSSILASMLSSNHSLAYLFDIVHHAGKGLR